MAEPARTSLMISNPKTLGDIRSWIDDAETLGYPHSSPVDVGYDGTIPGGYVTVMVPVVDP